MAVSIQIEPATGMAIATCSGVLRLDDALAGAASLWTTPGWGGRSVVWDLRTARLEVSSTEAEKTARFILERQPSSPPARVAFVVGRDLDFGMARVFEAYRHDPATEVQVFRDYDAALSWARSSDTG